MDVDALWLVLVPLAIITLLLLTSTLVLSINKKRLPRACEFIEVQGTRLHYCQKGSGPPVVLLHGSNGSSNDFRLSIMDELSKDFRVLAFDRPGHGYSQKAPGKQESCAVHGDLVREAWKSLGLERPVVVGHSSAGAVLMDMAVRHPEDVSGLVVLSGVVHSFEGKEVPVMGLYRALGRRYLGTALIWLLFLPLGGLIGRWLLKFTFAPDPVPKDYRKAGIALALRPSSLRAEAVDLECVGRTLRAVEGSYAGIRLPMVMVVGEKDRNVPPEAQCLRLSHEVPGAELVLLKDTGHMPMFTRPNEVIAAVHRVKELGNLGSEAQGSS
ncbi:MAG: alpha/beta hydrolase [Methanomassiliicoccales archaeon]|nr:alpha/beta hydrolase [Methanomassiliicoccales archaeon]